MDQGLKFNPIAAIGLQRHVVLIATPQKSRSSRLSDDPRGAQNSFANESPAVHIPV